MREALRLMRQSVDERHSVFLTFSGAMTPAGLHHSCILPLIARGVVHSVTTTGANLYHDIHRSIGFQVRELDPHASDLDYGRDQTVRIYDLGITSEILRETDKFVGRVMQGEAFQRAMTTAEFHRELGRAMAEHEEKNSVDPPSLLATCYRYGVPVFCGAPQDGGLFLESVQRSLLDPNFRFTIDIARDILQMAATQYFAQREGPIAIWILGGGVPKNYTLQGEVTLTQILGLKARGFDVDVQICVDVADNGALSPCTAGEGHTWGKTSAECVESNSVYLRADSTVAFPVLVHALLGQIAGERSPKRLLDRLAETESFVRTEVRRMSASQGTGGRALSIPASAGTAGRKSMTTFETLESEVRSYCRTFPAVFAKASGCCLFDEAGRRYLDFWSGAGSLNYGHNNPRLRAPLIRYLESCGITQGLDLATTAKRDFLERFESVILAPRGLEYRVQFPGPTGTNAVEAALKLARKVTERRTILSFANAFHGSTMGSLAVAGNEQVRSRAGVPLGFTNFLSFDGQLGPEVDTLDELERFLDGPGNGSELPAALILETVQGEGGVNVAGVPWLRRLGSLLHSRGVLLIVDDIQVGCGRTGSFFSFEPAGLRPDMVCLSKSIGGYGIPLALVLIKPELDVWKPGEHNGTFRGHNPAFVTAAAALSYWEDESLALDVERKARLVDSRMNAMLRKHSGCGRVRGRGLIQGLAFDEPRLAARVSREAFARGLVVETCGRDGDVLKILPPLVIEDEELLEGLSIIEESLCASLSDLR